MRTQNVSSSSRRSLLGPCDIESVLGNHDPAASERFWFESGNDGTAYLWLHGEPELQIHDAYTLREAQDILSTALSTPVPKSVVLAYKLDSQSDAADSITIASLLPTTSLTSDARTSYSDKLEAGPSWQTVKQRQPWPSKHLKAPMFWRGTHPSRWSIASAAALLLSVMFFVCVWALNTDQQPHSKPWQRYDVSGSTGPRYQLQFSYQNVSTWAATNDHSDGRWYLRIDDQAMIPHDLVDDEERHYQAWFQARYPEMNDIRLNEDYLDEAFLSDPSAIQVPADKTFHMAHCVRALRRYWQARESGHHVCPRDIDYRHMKHCLDSLDEWAFPEGPRGSVKSSMGMSTGADGKAKKDTTRLIWKTKVCFD